MASHYAKLSHNIGGGWWHPTTLIYSRNIRGGWWHPTTLSYSLNIGGGRWHPTTLRCFYNIGGGRWPYGSWVFLHINCYFLGFAKSALVISPAKLACLVEQPCGS